MSGFESVVEEAAIAWLTDLGVPVTAALAARNPPQEIEASAALKSRLNA
jgi:hypothetical protein